jgi:RNA polymerase primary sigma factor
MRQLKIIRQVTNRDNHTLDKYLHEIGKVNLITAEEEVELSRKIRHGDLLALEKLVKSNLRFVVSVAKQYQNHGLSLPDIINEGNLGLIKAAQRFDETRGFKFISYSVWWIRQAILQALAEQARIVRLPLNRIGSINKVNKTFSVLEQKYERDPTVLEISQALELAPEDVKDAISTTMRHVSMDAPITQDDENSMYDVLQNPESLSPDKDLLRDSLCKEIDRVLSTLTQRESAILSLYFGLKGLLPHSLDEIGIKLELTRERVRQIKEKAIKKIKISSRSRHLKTYLG